MPLLLAVSPMPMEAPTPLFWPMPEAMPIDAGQVETFDPVGRARLIAEILPRLWSGSFSAFDGSGTQPVELRVVATAPMGQMVDLRGEIRIGNASTSVQGTINAKSDQLDLILLNDEPMAGLEAGTNFQGLQGISLSGWRVNRLTSPGGRLQLSPAAAAPAEPAAGGTIRGLW